MRVRSVTVILVLLSVCCTLAVRDSAAQGNANPGVIPPNSQYAQLSAQWWQWVFSQPVVSNPLFDTTGALAANGQPANGNVFFLAGLISPNGDPLSAHVERSITIAAGTRLFFPILNSEFDNVGVDPPFDVAQLRSFAAASISSVTSLYTTIDGRAVQNPAEYRTLSPVFSYTLPAVDNLYQFFNIDVSGTQYPAVGDGYYLLLTPLSPGRHTIAFGGTTQTVDQYGNPAGIFHLDIVYHITVKAGK